MKKYDFSGYATKNDLKCSDGRTIRKDAFKENDGQKVPLVWQHVHNDPSNVLGHAILENREDGVYAYCKLNDTDAGKNAKELVKHGDITALSIFANKLVEKGGDVLHGAIREVSLVLTGANPGAMIDFLTIEHSDGSYETDNTEALIYMSDGIKLSKDLMHSEEGDEEGDDPDNLDGPEEGDGEEDPESLEHAEGKTVQDIFDTLNEEQKEVVYFMVGKILEDGEVNHSDEGGELMKKNVFDNKDDKNKGATLSHSQLQEIMADAQKCGSLKESFLAHAVTYGIENIDYLFPDAQTIANTPDLVARRTEWVNGVINGAKHTPFSRIKSMSADLTLDTARAKGYIKGTLKKEEFFALSRRTTTPTTIYKKQKLDRDDIIDITDLDVVAWLKAEMRLMLDEELARAALIGDGREPDDDDKITETCIRPIAFDDDFYTHKVTVPANTTAETVIEYILRARPNYKGSGNPDFFTTESVITDMLLIKDKMGRRLYPTTTELAAALRVGRIIPVEVMETETNLLGILVNMSDYTFGADKGGNISMFDDFDIDYNQYKYLIETRCSGCLTKPKSAIAINRAAGTLATPTAPTFVPSTGVLTIPTVTGVEYYNFDTDEKLTAGAQAAMDGGVSIEVEARPATGYYFAHNIDNDWVFTSTKA